MDRLNIDDYMNYHPFSQEVLVKEINDSNFDEGIFMKVYHKTRKKTPSNELWAGMNFVQERKEKTKQTDFWLCVIIKLTN